MIGKEKNVFYDVLLSARSEQFWSMMVKENEHLAKQLSLMQASYKTANEMFNHYVYCTRTNNWLKRHGLPMRRKEKRNGTKDICAKR